MRHNFKPSKDRYKLGLIKVVIPLDEVYFKPSKDRYKLEDVLEYVFIVPVLISNPQRIATNEKTGFDVSTFGPLFQTLKGSLQTLPFFYCLNIAVLIISNPQRIATNEILLNFSTCLISIFQTLKGSLQTFLWYTIFQKRIVDFKPSKDRYKPHRSKRSIIMYLDISNPQRIATNHLCR